LSADGRLSGRCTLTYEFGYVFYVCPETYRAHNSPHSLEPLAVPLLKSLIEVQHLVRVRVVPQCLSDVAITYCIFNDLLHTPAFPICIYVHVRVIRIAILHSPTKPVKPQPGIPHNYPLVILMFCRCCSPDAPSILLNISRLVQFGDDVILLQTLYQAYRPIAPILSVYIEERTMKTDVIEGLLSL
jgi:hypothetical protein